MKGKGKSRGWSEAGGGFVLEMQDRRLSGVEELDIHWGRGLFYMSALADSSGQEFRSSFCHRAYAVTKTCQSTAAAGHKLSSTHTLSCFFIDVFQKISATGDVVFAATLLQYSLPSDNVASSNN